jgi:hypothetical protein
MSRVVYINGEKEELSFLDTPQTILSRWAIHINELPEYLRFNDNVIDNENIRIEYLADYIKSVSIDEFLDNIDLYANWNEFFPIDKIELTLFFLNLSDDGMSKLSIITDEQLQTIQESIDPNLNSLQSVQTEIKKYKKTTIIRKKKIESDITLFEKLSKLLTDLPSVQTSNFVITESNFESTGLDISVNPLQLFDESITTIDTPILHLKHQNKSYYKVDKNILLLPIKQLINDWLKEFKKAIDGLYFLILLDNDNYFSCSLNFEQKRLDIMKRSLLKSNRKKLTQQELIDTIQKFLSIKIEKLEESRVKGEFTTIVKNYNKTVILDLISNNFVFKYFTFLYELEKLASEKSRLSFYFNSVGLSKNRSNSIYITLTQINNKTLLVRVSRTKNLIEVNSFINIFSRLISLYIKEYDSVVKEYTRFFSEEELLKQENEAIDKPDVTQKSKTLQERKPDLFLIKEYVRKCQKEKQPYIIDDVQEYKTVYGDNKIIEYENAHYGCEPRDPTRPKDIDYVYPGLQINSQSNSGRYPFVPCCFKTDQYSKKGSSLNKHIVGDVLSKATTYIVCERKMVTDKHNGEIPLFIKNSLINLGYTDVQKGKKTVFSFLRRGVPANKESILYCLELSKDINFEKLDRENIIKEVKTLLVKQPLSCTRQETIGYSDAELRDKLQNEFIESKLFISLLEEYYQTNIYIFSICDVEEIEIPRYKNIFIPGRKRFSESVLLFRYGKYYNIMFDVKRDSCKLDKTVFKLLYEKYNYLTKLYVL